MNEGIFRGGEERQKADSGSDITQQTDGSAGSRSPLTPEERREAMAGVAAMRDKAMRTRAAAERLAHIRGIKDPSPLERHRLYKEAAAQLASGDREEVEVEDDTVREGTRLPAGSTVIVDIEALGVGDSHSVASNPHIFDVKTSLSELKETVVEGSEGDMEAERPDCVAWALASAVGKTPTDRESEIRTIQMEEWADRYKSGEDDVYEDIWELIEKYQAEGTPLGLALAETDITYHGPQSIEQIIEYMRSGLSVVVSADIPKTPGSLVDGHMMHVTMDEEGYLISLSDEGAPYVELVPIAGRGFVRMDINNPLPLPSEEDESFIVPLFHTMTLAPRENI